MEDENIHKVKVILFHEDGGPCPRAVSAPGFMNTGAVFPPLILRGRYAGQLSTVAVFSGINFLIVGECGDFSGSSQCFI